MSLWSSHDVYLGHFRRYRRSELEKVVASAGLKIESSHYLFSSLLPVVYLLRRLGYRKNSGSNMTEMPRSVNSILLRIHQFENRFIRNSLFGLSVVLVANKIHWFFNLFFIVRRNSNFSLIHCLRSEYFAKFLYAGVKIGPVIFCQIIIGFIALCAHLSRVSLSLTIKYAHD